MNLGKMKIENPSIDVNVIKKYFSMLTKTFPEYRLCNGSIATGMFLENTLKVFTKTDTAQFMIDLCANEYKEETFVSVKEGEMFTMLKVSIEDLDNFLSDDDFRNKFYENKSFIDITEDVIGALEDE